MVYGWGIVLIYLATIIPSVGIWVIIKNEKNNTATYLLLADVFCLVANSCQSQIMLAPTVDVAQNAIIIQYISFSAVYLFFFLFVYEYFKVKVNKIFFGFWLLIETVGMCIVWMDHLRPILFFNLRLQEADRWGMHYVHLNIGWLMAVRFAIISIMLISCIVHTMIHRNKLHQEKEINQVNRLLLAEVILAATPYVSFILHMQYDITPVGTSIAILLVIINVSSGAFYSAMDRGIEGVSNDMKQPVVVANALYEFVYANSVAIDIMPELEHLKTNSPLPEGVKHLYIQDESDAEIGNQCYQRILTKIYDGDILTGYSLLLIDVTEKRDLMVELKKEKERAEVANEAKSAFVSSMSHEIRTPMNAIIGITDILLRNHHSEQETEYLMNIKNSGAALLAIINDILDFSKIESGKMEIVEEEYEPMSMISDLSMIGLNRIGEKDVELLFDISPDMPKRLKGDALRIRQVLLNILNNAIKFTEHGYVKMTLDVEKRDDGRIDLIGSIEDTGQGMHQEDLEKIFESFQQVDTKKNRAKEGSGLGLAISKNMLELMHGSVQVESTYGEGSCFYFRVAQKIVNEKRAAVIKEERKWKVAGVFDDSFMWENFKKMVEGYGMEILKERTFEQVKPDFLFIEKDSFLQEQQKILKLGQEGVYVFVVQNPMFESYVDNRVEVIGKPLYSLNFCQAINHEKSTAFTVEEDYMTFIAPKASVLIVDDMEMNLNVAKGLMAPLQMHIDTASSGPEALEMLEEIQYDLVFLDHMMPGMDGIEVVQKIREKTDEYYQNLPIIALTANAVNGAREGFIIAGMNDMISKPIDMKELCNKLRNWLPEEYIIRKKISMDNPWKQEEFPEIPGLDVEEGIKNCGTREIYANLIHDVYRIIDMKADKVQSCFENGEVREFTVEVHALKHTAKMMGDLALSDRFLRMEELGNDGSEEAVREITEKLPDILKDFRAYKEILEKYCTRCQFNNQETNDNLQHWMQKMKEAVEAFDMDQVDEVMKKIEEQEIPEAFKKDCNLLGAYVVDVDMEKIQEITNKILGEM